MGERAALYARARRLEGECARLQIVRCRLQNIGKFGAIAVGPAMGQRTRLSRRRHRQPIQTAIADRFGQVFAADAFAAGKVGDAAGDAQDALMRAC